MADADREKWNAKWRERAATPSAPSPFVVSLAAMLPRSGRALDVAGGAGRHAVFFAQRGLDVTLVDVSDAGLELARAAADAAGVSLATARIDLGVDPLPSGPWDVILCFHYLGRRLFAEFAEALAPRGLLVFVQPTRSNLERHAHPSAAFLLEDGELPRLVRGLEIVRYEEGWLDEGRHEARLIARKE